MRIHLGDPELLPDLLRFLRQRVDVIAEPVAIDEIEVGLLGSRNADASRLELDLRLRAWQAAHPDRVDVEVVD